MQKTALDLLRRTLFPPEASLVSDSIAQAGPIRPDMSTFDPSTPRTPSSLDSVGLKAASPYTDGAQFHDILIGLIADQARYRSSKLTTFKSEMSKYLTHLAIDNEACLNQMEDGSWTGNTIPSQDGRSEIKLTMITPPVLTMLRKIALASVSVTQVSRYLSDEVSFSALTEWSTAISNLTHPVSASRGLNTGGVQASGSNKPKSKDIPSFKVSPFVGSILKGDRYIQKTANTFKSYGAYAYLTDASLCAKQTDFSQAYASRLRESLVDNAELMYIATTHKNEDNCAKLWEVIHRTLMSQKLSLSRECALWKELFDLRCDDVDKFPRFYSETVTIFHDLKELKSVAETDDNFKRVFLHKHIEVDELKDSTKLFVTDFAGSAEKLLEGVKRDHSTLQTSEAIKDDKPGSILKGGTVRRAEGSKDSKPDLSVGFKGTYVTAFPRNIGNKIPDEIYKQIKSWYLVMAKKDKEPADMKFLNDFTFEDRKTRAELDATKANKNGGGKGNNRYKEKAHARRAAQRDEYDRDDRRGGYYNDRDRYDRGPPRYNDRDNRDQRGRSDEYHDDRNVRSRHTSSSMMSGNSRNRY